MPEYRAVDKHGTVVGLQELEGLLEAMEWALNVGARGAHRVERKDGDVWAFEFGRRE